MSQEIVEAVRDIEREKGIESGTLVAALEDALLAAYKKMPGAARHAVVEIDDEGDFRVFAVELPPDIEERLIEEARERKLEELEALEVETGERSHTLISDNVLDDLGKVEALLPRSEQVDGERYEQGSRIKAVITEVRSGTKGPQVILSRRDPELIKTLFELEVPEIADGLVEIRGVAREPGYRSKIAVESHAQGVDPVGACVGPRGSRVRMVFLDDEAKEATVITPDDQLALAIGKEGMNARLAARLTGWKIDITSDTEFAQQEAEAAFGGEEGEEGDFSGRCAAILSNGKRCPNASLPGSRYCGVPAHQELALHEANAEDNPIVDEAEPELEALSDTAEPEAVTEDAAAFGNPEPEEFPAGPGDAPVTGEDQTLDSGAAHPQHVHVTDDPHAGIPIREG